MTMTFSKFAKTLRPFVGGSIWEFTSNLLSGGLKSRLEYIEELNPDTLRKYYHGERQLTKLWADLYDVWDEQEFIRYIETTYKADSFEDISECFCKLEVSITPDNVPKRLAEIFSSIMDKVLQGASKSSPKEGKTALQMLEHDRESLAKTIEQLDESLHHVQDPLHDNLIIWDYMSEQEKEEFKKDITSHISVILNCSQKVKLLAKRYPDFSDLMKLYTLGKDFFARYYAVHAREDLADYVSYLTEFCEVVDLVSRKLIVF